jgi:hypothetical protein
MAAVSEPIRTTDVTFGSGGVILHGIVVAPGPNRNVDSAVHDYCLGTGLRSGRLAVSLEPGGVRRMPRASQGAR